MAGLFPPRALGSVWAAGGIACWWSS